VENKVNKDNYSKTLCHELRGHNPESAENLTN